MQLMKLGDSYYLKSFGSSDGGSAVVARLRSFDFSKYEISEASKFYLMGIIERKISSTNKDEILSLLQNGTISLIVADKDDHYPSFIPFIPMMVGTRIKFFLNIGFYAKYDKASREVKDIDPRVLFALLSNGYAQYKIYSNPGKLADIKLQEIIRISYIKIFNKVMSKIVGLNTITNEEKLTYDCILNGYVARTMLRKDESSAESYVRSSLTKPSMDKDKLETQIKATEIKNLDSLDGLLEEIKKKCPSFIKLNGALFIREYAISMKSSAVLSIDLVQIFVGVLLAVQAGSSGIFNDKLVEGVLDGKELDHLKIAIARI